MAPDNETDDFRGELRAALARHFSEEELAIETFSRRGEGYSWETYLVSIRRRPQNGMAAVERYAVKREPAAGLLPPYDVQREVELLRVAKETGCPVPDVILHSLRDDDRRGFYVMEMVEGVVPMPWDVKKVIPDGHVRHRLGLELADIMARIHRWDVASVQIPGLTPAGDARATGATEADKWHRIYLECKSTHVPILDLAFAWLAHRADHVSGRTALVHNDLRVGNVIVRDDRVVAVLDWETAAITDPAADLAKFNLPTFRGRSSLASGLIEWDRFLDAYESQTGWRPDEATLNYWSVMEIAKTAVGGLLGAHCFYSGKTDDIRYANLGFQSHHAIRWLVELFETGQWGR
ncbi:phosphotransferase family protein [Burkholderia multivorans]|uniref:phosphotransferase family protein n=1 Tax=Burkholderia multivorans TaxID=87883 RepID=UPI0019D2B653|nr:phosphotransferase family protein [Burkholderia multivorans]MBN6731258.1 phosphotransferase family protein [Burkholderia multivorans]MBN6733472.1 phosphotransferase family protein [Burkholderia multivorans]MBN7130390.1 phosphotransferase family protein [Burkholderia multivorans]MBN8165072.1 phosphotransferase family protein [Burkholderia multivorans]MBN8170861.1 phosphotransferase family protein [Burkholderia multivorans]